MGRYPPRSRAGSPPPKVPHVLSTARMRRALLAVLALSALSLVPAATAGPMTVPSWSGLRAGVAVTDATWHVGAGAGQYASTPDPSDPKRSEWDPNVESVKQIPSYGVASRLTIRAIVLKSPGRPPVALVKDDNYLAQDMLIRRAAQLLAERGSAVTYDNLLVSATHDHNSPYYSTPAAGVWLFQDVADLRMFEYQARAIATAVQSAERGMRPARLGAATVEFPWFHGNIAGGGVGEDGAPVGYPMMENDHGLTVVRIDDMTDPAQPKPLTTYVNYAQHGESLDGYDLISADWLAPFERFVDRGTGAPVVFSQGSVGSAEGPYDNRFPGGNPSIEDHGDAVKFAWAHTGFSQAERGTHLLADKVLAAWRAIGGEDNGVTVAAPMSSDVPVQMVTHFVPGPVSHPYPSVSNCRTDQTVNGNPGSPVLGLPDCQRISDVGTIPSPPLWDSLRATGLPIPASYDAASFGSVEENLRIKLQAVRLGEVLLASCACEPQSDLIKALETRTDKVAGNQWNGMDYANQNAVAAAYPLADSPVRACFAVPAGYSCPRSDSPINGEPRLTVSKAAFDRMEAEINNPADGWDDPTYAPYANSEPDDIKAIKGNFTRRELAPSCGYAVPVGLGHSSDYNGYTVSYREYVARDSYRKALTSYGAHTADYMVSRLVAMAAFLRCGTPLPAEPLDALAAADEARQVAESTALGQVSSYYYDAWTAQIPDSQPAKALTQPRDIKRFDAATFSWVGGDNWSDNPNVIVERFVGGQWVRYADMSGEVQTILTPPSDAASGAVDRRQGLQSWIWTASFEAFDSYPRADVPGGQVPDGTYQFYVKGIQHVGGALQEYAFFSKPFHVGPWTGITVSDLTRDADGSVSFVVDPIVYPRTYTSPIAFVGDDHGKQICKTCAFRAWASTGQVASAQVHVDGVAVPATLGPDGRWHASAPGASSVTVEPGDIRDAYGETNGARFTA
ncbi:MAG: hypothetical protein QOJ92_2961 [Frankiales bacterium]|nr:hypothetical protein [Frankiales bacterium]